MNVATPPAVAQPSYTHNSKPPHPISLNIHNNLKDNKKGKGSTTTEQASPTDASTSGDATTTTDTAATTEGFANLDDNTEKTVGGQNGFGR